MVYEIKSQLTNNYDLKARQTQTSSVSTMPMQGRQDGILKQVFPQYIYNPPYGFPKRLNGVFLRRLSSNINVSSVLKTIKDEIILTPWEIAVEKDVTLTDAEEKELKEIEDLFKNPNPDDTFDSWCKKLLEDLFVLEAGCYYNVLDRVGRIKQLRTVDGDSILKNPDIHGSFDSREGVITNFNNFLFEADKIIAKNDKGSQNSSHMGGDAWKHLQSRYGTLYTSKAAYFQYNAAMAYSYPIPYGKDEMVYIQMNPSSYNVYTNGSPVSDAVDVILALSYSVKYHLDFYLNGNTPEGMINLAGGTADDIENFKTQMKNATYTLDEQSGYERRMGYVLPIVNSDNAQFIPMTFNSKDMEILASQSLLNKLLWGRFGVTADEMGATENSNRATSKTQTDNAKRKAVLPILKVLEDNFNKYTINKFFKLGREGKVKFKFKPDDTAGELTKREIWQKDVDLGITTWQMIAEKEGIDLAKLTKHKDENFEKQQAQQPDNNNFNNNKVNDTSESNNEFKSEGGHKYIKRTGSSGNYTYFYNDVGKTKTSKINITDGISAIEFNLKELNRVGSGLDRVVFDLGEEKLLKVASTPRGLLQNSGVNEKLIESNIMPKVYEQGRNYLIVEKLNIDDKKTKGLLKDLKQFNQSDVDSKNPKLLSEFENIKKEYGTDFSEILNHEVHWADFTQDSNWGWTKDNKPKHLDEGTFKKDLLNEKAVDKFNNEFSDIITDLREHNKKKKELKATVTYKTNFIEDHYHTYKQGDEYTSSDDGHTHKVSKDETGAIIALPNIDSKSPHAHKIIVSESSYPTEMKGDKQTPMEKVMDKYNLAIEKKINEIIKEN